MSRERRIYSVAELLEGVRALLEDSVGRVWVSGETSNVFRAPSGHYYFTLKDASGQIRCVFFRNDARRLAFELVDGLDLLLEAQPSVYTQRGELQLIVRAAEPRGAGALALAFEQLRQRLDAEGLFDPARKRALPVHPRRVAIVTSPRGAAIRDVIQVSGRRSPATPLLLSPTRVQGEGVEFEIAAAIERLAAVDDVDVVLVVRGGGSLEDLWCFNTEVVVRAIANARVPVVCGVGHETDVTLADFAADVRAATPSAAAMLALPDRAALASDVAALWDRLASAGDVAVRARWQRLDRARGALRAVSPAARLRARRERWRAALRALVRSGRGETTTARARYARAALRLAANAPRAASQRARLTAAARALGHALERGPLVQRARLATLAAQLDSLSPLGVLGRGYAVVRRAQDARIVRAASDVAPGDRLELRVARARIEAEVVATHEVTGPGEPADG